MRLFDIPQETKLKIRVVAMAGSSFLNDVRKVFGTLALIIPFLALSGCGEGDGPTSIPNTAIPPLDLPPGFCDPINFEVECEPPAIIWFGGGQTVVVDNPDKSGINLSDKVARMQKFFDQPFGGTRLNPLEVPVDFSAGEAYKIKVWSESPVPVLFKLEETNDGTLGVARTVEHSGGSAWEELCFDFTGVTPANTIGLTIIFNNDVQGGAIGGVFEGDWTFYYDDITQVESCVDTGPPTGIVPDVKLYDPTATPPISTDVDVTAFGSESVIDPEYADDDTYGRVLAVSSGVGYGANIAQIGFIGGDPGFVTFYESVDFKVKGMPNLVVFVSLYEGGERVRINLSSSGLASALGGGWYQVSIPVSSFTGLTTATGIVFESDDTAPMQFTMLLTDIGFTGLDDGGDGGDSGAVITAGLFSETNNDTVITVLEYDNSADFGGNNTVATPVTASSLTNGVTAFEGTDVLEIDFQDTGGDFGGALFDLPDVDISAFTTLKFSVNVSQFPGFADVTIQFEPPTGPQPGNNVFLSAYTPVSTAGDWSTYEIPLADFPGATLTAVDFIGFWNARSAPIDGPLAFGQLYLDDVHLTAPCDTDCDSGGDGGGDGGDAATAGIVSETNNDTVIAVAGFVNSADFGGNNTVGNVVSASSLSNGVTAFEGSEVLEIDYQNTGGDFGGALINIQGVDISANTALKFSINTSQIPGIADLTIQIEPPGGPQPGNNVALSAYTPVSTSGDWSTYEIPLTDFPGATLSAVDVIGFWNARDGGGALVFGQLYLDDIHLVGSGSGGTGGDGGTGGGDPVEGNIAINGGFETGAFNDGSDNASWQQFPNGGIQTIVTTNPSEGTYAANLNVPVRGPGDSAVDNLIKNANRGAGSLTPNAPVTITWDMRGSLEGAGGVVFVELFSELATEGVSKAEIYTNGPIFPDDPDTWTSYTWNTTLGADVSGGVTLQLKASCGPVVGCGLDVYFDNVTIVVN
jgi:hypothetical protein